MKPCYDKDGITLYCADNCDVDMPSAGMILTDPPYSDTTHQGARTSADWNVSGGNEAPALGIEFASVSDADVRDIFTRLAPLAQRWIVSFLDWRHVSILEQHTPAGLRFVRHGVWVAPNKAPQFTGDRPGVGWESIAILHKAGGRMRWNGGGKHGVWTHNVAHMAHRISDHPNAKPIPLLATIIQDFSDHGDLILDPFCGSGAVLAAAKLTGRRAFGVEMNEAYCEDIVFWLEHGRPRRAAKKQEDTSGQLTLDLAA